MNTDKDCHYCGLPYGGINHENALYCSQALLVELRDAKAERDRYKRAAGR